MKKVGEGSKPIGARMVDYVKDKEEQKSAKRKMTFPEDSDELGVDTKTFLKSGLQYGLNYVPRLRAPLLPGAKVPVEYRITTLDGEGEREISLNEFIGYSMLIVFYPKAMTPEADEVLNMLAELATTTANSGVDVKILAVSTDAFETHRIWLKDKAGGTLPTIISDKSGDMARLFGVLDTSTHTAFTAIFLVDSDAVVQGVMASGVGGLRLHVTVLQLTKWIKDGLKKVEKDLGFVFQDDKITTS